MVLSNDQKVEDMAASYRDLCFKLAKRFYQTELCCNFRMSNLQAAPGVAQLEHIEEFVAAKRTLGRYIGRNSTMFPTYVSKSRDPMPKRSAGCN
jgi:dTDP-4-amino-4,6-dideoxygalactose transaminase